MRQACASSVITYAELSGAIDPSRIALTPSRSQRSRATAAVSGSFGERSISCSVERTCEVGSTFTYGDCCSWISSASFSAPSKTASPVVLEKSASSSGSRGAGGGAPPRYQVYAP